LGIGKRVAREIRGQLHPAEGNLKLIKEGKRARHKKKKVKQIERSGYTKGVKTRKAGSISERGKGEDDEETKVEGGGCGRMGSSVVGQGCLSFPGKKNKRWN